MQQDERPPGTCFEIPDLPGGQLNPLFTNHHVIITCDTEPSVTTFVTAVKAPLDFER
jgi:hypothetical protein